MEYNKKLKEIRARYNPESLYQINERMDREYSSFDSDIVKYVKQSMKEVDPDYTKKTKDAGEAVKAHLSASLLNVSYEYQGSVMTDTHIRGASDIDLLVLCEKFYGSAIDEVRRELQYAWKYDYNQQARLRNYDNSFSPYQGNSSQDLAYIRSQIEYVMKSKYSICDISKAKAVKITNQNLHRDVDIVTSSWYQSLDYVLNGMPPERRGIKIYNKDKGYAEGPDFPFLSISRINSRSAETYGRLKRMIRFLKNVRTDSDFDIPLTSFDINAICYSIPVRDYIDVDYKGLVCILWLTMYNMLRDNKQDNLVSVAGDEYIFRNNPEKINALKILKDEVYKIYTDLDK